MLHIYIAVTVEHVIFDAFFFSFSMRHAFFLHKFRQCCDLNTSIRDESISKSMYIYANKKSGHTVTRIPSNDVVNATAASCCNDSVRPHRGLFLMWLLRIKRSVVFSAIATQCTNVTDRRTFIAIMRRIIAQYTPTDADATQLVSCVASASAVCIGYIAVCNVASCGERHAAVDKIPNHL